jgi:hypothetical protein
MAIFLCQSIIRESTPFQEMHIPTDFLNKKKMYEDSPKQMNVNKYDRNDKIIKQT